jgi:hypothetical protein
MNVVAVSALVEALYPSDTLYFSCCGVPDAALKNARKLVVSELSLAGCICCGVIAADPSKLTPPIALGVTRVFALATERPDAGSSPSVPEFI